MSSLAKASIESSEETVTYALATYGILYALAVRWGVRHVSDPGPMTDLVWGFARLIGIIIGGGILAIPFVLGAILL
jgi:hypothetical protein